jgi:M6 family metalloprotease-like protein
MSRRIGSSLTLVTAIGIILLASVAQAVAPTKEAVDKWKAEGVLDQKLAPWRSFLAAGGCTPSAHPVWNKEKFAAAAAQGAATVDTQDVLVILIQFPDNQFSNPTGGIANAFDSLLFSDKLSGGRVNPTGSMTDYYREVSYGKLYIGGGVYGPYTASHAYSYYVGSDDGFSRSPGLVREALSLAQADVPWSEFAANGTTIVPNVVVIHAGLGAETGAAGIWSHKSSVGSFSLLGYSFGDYNMDPEFFQNGVLSGIGVFCHEFGHTLGLPDLYDTQYNPGSEGIGEWSLMASGNYNGSTRSPAALDCWCKLQLGFIEADSIRLISSNKYNMPIPAIEYTPVIYTIPDSTWTNPSDTFIRYYSQEYWLVENRQKMGTDVGLPGAGLLIYHVDNGVSTNNDPTRYHVAIEQADGHNSLAIGGTRGDAGDPYPGTSNNRAFDNFSDPNSRLNVGGTVTQVGVWNISNSDSIMYANFDYTYSHPLLKLVGADSLTILDTTAGNSNDSITAAGETATFYCRVQNFMRPAYNWTMTLSCDDPDVQFVKNGLTQGVGNLLNPSMGARKADSLVVFQLGAEATGKYTTFTLTITADSLFHAGDRAYSASWQFKQMLGTPQVLFVDDDSGQTLESQYVSICQGLNMPYRIWNKAVGSPTLSAMNAAKNVFWIQGAPPTGEFSAGDVTTLKSFLDGGGRFATTSSAAVPQLQILDSTFLQTYLHAQAGDSVISAAQYFFGTNGNPVSDSSKYKFGGATPDAAYTLQNITPVNGGSPAFFSSYRISGNPNLGNCGVTYSGAYKTVLLSFPLEYLSAIDTLSGFRIPDTLFARIMSFFGGNATGITDHGSGTLPHSFVLKQNYPNPFNPSTVIAYTLPAVSGSASRARTVLDIYNMLGQKVRTLVNVDQAPGDYKVTWDGTTDGGTRVSSGLYLYHLSHGDFNSSKKMVLLK